MRLYSHVVPERRWRELRRRCGLGRGWSLSRCLGSSMDIMYCHFFKRERARGTAKASGWRWGTQDRLFSFHGKWCEIIFAALERYSGSINLKWLQITELMYLDIVKSSKRNCLLHMWVEHTNLEKENVPNASFQKWRESTFKTCSGPVATWTLFHTDPEVQLRLQRSSCLRLAYLPS